MTRRRFHIRKGDTVEVINGRDRGRRGEVERVVPDKGRVVVEGVNVRKRHTKPRAVGQSAGIIEFNAPFDASNVLPVCPHCGKRTRSAVRFGGDGLKERYCKECGESIDV